MLAPGLKVVFCGTAPGDASARVGAYYAGPGNRFWETLHRVGLTPYQLPPHEFSTVIQYGIGLTDLAKHTSGSDASLHKRDFDAAALHQKIEHFAPRVLAFTSKRGAQEYFGVRRVDYGLHAARMGRAHVFVLPSPSGAARRYWDVGYWQELADWIYRTPHSHRSYATF